MQEIFSFGVPCYGGYGPAGELWFAHQVFDDGYFLGGELGRMTSETEIQRRYGALYLFCPVPQGCWRPSGQFASELFRKYLKESLQLIKNHFCIWFGL